jgi:hypothetical protein
MNRQIKFKIDSKTKLEKLENGFLKVDSFATRAGIFPYGDGAGGKILEFRSEEEVFSQDSLETLKAVPVTFTHPQEKLNSDNFKEYSVGMTGENVRKIVEDGVSYVGLNLVLTDNDIIDFVLDRRDQGKSVELSCGYSASVIPQPGLDEKEGRYDAVQTNIRYNHVSIVEEGRAGENVKIKLDKAIEKSQKNKPRKSKEDKKKMKFIKNLIKTKSFNMDAIDVEVSDDAIAPLNALGVKVDEAVTAIKAGEEKNDALTTELEETKTKLDEAEKAKADLAKENEELSNLDSERIQKMVKARADMDEVAGLLKVDINDSKGVRKDKKTLRDEIIALHIEDSALLKDKDDAYKDASYDTIQNAVFKNKNDAGGNESLSAFHAGAAITKKSDSTGNEELSARDKFKADTKDLHKKKD